MKICSRVFAVHQTTASVYQKMFLFGLKVLLGLALFSSQNSLAVIRDGGVDPNNLGQGGWLYIMKNATNKMSPNNIASVTNENSLFAYLKSQNLNYVIVKAATSNRLWTGSGNVPIGSPGAQFTSNLVKSAHANGLLIFGSNRSYGNDIPGEIAVADYVFQQGADGFIYDAEAEWESSRPWITTNGAKLAWQLCSTVRSNWPTKFIAHNPIDTVYLHFSFPFKEFGYWTDAVMPQVYHHAASKNNAIAAMHWSDVHFKKLHDYLYSLPITNINGMTVNWANAVKPLIPMRDVYNGGASTPVHPDTDVRDFLDYLVADPNCPDPSGFYNGSDYFRSELHSQGQWAHIRASTIGNFPNVVNNIILDDARTIVNGPWQMIKTIDATTSTVIFSGETTTDTNSFGTNYWAKGKGTGTNYIQFTPRVVVPGSYNVYQWHPYRADASTNVPFVINYLGGSTTVYANQKTNAGNWTLLGKFPFGVGTNGNIRVTDGFSEASGIAMADGIKMIFASAILTPPGPTGLVATAISKSQINLNWKDNSTNETGFVISRSTVSGGPYSSIASVGANVTNYNNTGLTVNTTYYYVVHATNAAGPSPYSNEASALTRDEPPRIVSQSMSQTVLVGQNVVLNVNATGTPTLIYQWQKDTVDLQNGGNISGAKTPVLTIQSVTLGDAGTYAVLVTNLIGSVLSTNIVLTVTSLPPSVVQHPVSTNCNAGTTARFSVAVTGSLPMTYQWKRGTTNLANGGKISGANSPTLVLTNVLRADQGSYSVTVSNSVGFASSFVANLTVVDPAINIQPVSITNGAGSTAVFSVSAGGTPPLRYGWKKGNVFLTDDGRISGAVSPSLTLAAVLKADAGEYSVVVSNSLGQVTSIPATLTVIDPIILSQPVSRTNVAGTTATFTVNTAGTMPINYQWKKGNSLVQVGPNVSGLNTASLTLHNVSQSEAGDYSVFISNLAGDATSSLASLVVIDPVVITSQPTNQTVFEGTNIIVEVVATGTPPLTYQWQYNETVLVDATNASYSISNAQVTNTGIYSVIVSNQVGAVTSSNALIQVNLPFRIDSIDVNTRPSSVIVTWVTTSNSTSQVEYGLTPDLGSFSAISTAMVQNHSILLVGLIPDTNYFFRVVSSIGESHLKSEIGMFATTASIIVDNPQAFLDGNWTRSSSAGNYGGYFEYIASKTGAPSAEARFVPNLISTGRYDVYLWFADGASRASNVPVYLLHKNGLDALSINQSIGGTGWHLLASEREFLAGTEANVRLLNNTGESNRLVIADAAKWTYNPGQDYTPAGVVPDWWANYYFGANVDANLDPDGDGYSTYKEYVIGSIPNETGSQLSFQIKPGASNTLEAVFLPRLETRVYELEGSDDLSAWQPVSGNLTNDTSGKGTITFAPASGNKKFYRLKVRFP